MKQLPASLAIGLGLLLAPVVVVSGQVSYTVSEAVRLPAESFVGDTVELRYSIRTTYQPSDPVVAGEPLWGTIESTRMVAQPDGFEVRIVVVPYETGTLTLPALILGEIRLEDLSLVVSSVLGNDATLRPIHGPQYLPRTRSTIALLLLALILIPTTVIYLLGPGRKHLGTLYAVYRARAPYRQFIHRLDELEQSAESLSGKEFYIELVCGLQLFMGARLGKNCTSLTSTELSAELPDLARSSGSTPEATTPLVEVFGVADAVKFAQKRIRRSFRVEHMALARLVAETLEAARRRNRRRSQRRALWLRRSRASEASSVGV